MAQKPLFTDERLTELKKLALTMSNAALAKHFGVGITTIKDCKVKVGMGAPKRTGGGVKPKKRMGYQIVRVNDYTLRCVRLG
jgi:transposase